MCVISPVLANDVQPFSRQTFLMLFILLGSAIICQVPPHTFEICIALGVQGAYAGGRGLLSEPHNIPAK